MGHGHHTHDETEGHGWFEGEELELMQIADREREELLERIKGKKYQSEMRSLCRTVLVGMMDKAVESSDEKHYSDMVSGIVEVAWIELCERRIVEDMGG